MWFNDDDEPFDLVQEPDKAANTDDDLGYEPPEMWVAHDQPDRPRLTEPGSATAAAACGPLRPPRPPTPACPSCSRPAPTASPSRRLGPCGSGTNEVPSRAYCCCPTTTSERCS